MNNFSPQRDTPSPLRVPLVDLLLDRRTDILAFAAFVLALSTAIAQLVVFLKGPRVSIIPPKQVMIIFSPTRSSDLDTEKGGKNLRVYVQMGYVNSGEYGQTAVVIDEWVAFRLGDKTYVQHAHSIEHITDKNYDNKLEFEFLDPVSPLPIAGVSAASRPVYFAPFPVRDTMGNCKRDHHFLSREDFIREFAKSRSITFFFFYRIAGDDEPQPADCKADMIQNAIKCTVNATQLAWTTLISNDWASLVCWPPEESTPDAVMGNVP